MVGGRVRRRARRAPSAASRRPSILLGKCCVSELDFQEVAHYRPRRVGVRAAPSFPGRHARHRRGRRRHVPGRSHRRGDPGVGRPADRVSRAASTAIAARRSPTGSKSLAYTIAYRAPDRTLTDDEVNAAHERRAHAPERPLRARTPELRPAMTMTKADIVERIYEKVGFSKKEATEVVESVFEMVKRRLESGEKVKISGFGNFVVQREAAAQGPQPADRRRDRHHRPTRAHVQGEPGPQEDDERRRRARDRARA